MAFKEVNNGFSVPYFETFDAPFLSKSFEKHRFRHVKLLESSLPGVGSANVDLLSQESIA